MNDSWCMPFWDGKKWIYGGAARSARIARAGGMDSICPGFENKAAMLKRKEIMCDEKKVYGENVITFSRRAA